MLIKQLVILALLVIAAGCSNSPPTTTGNFRNQGYLMDAAGGNAVVKSLGYDVCVRTSDWTPARANVECDPDLVPKPMAKAPAAPPPRDAAPPAKIVAKPSAKPVPQRFTLSADALFDFDKATLKPAGRHKLDELAGSLSGIAYDTIVATGHTDRAGSTSYNQQLSERRAHAVRDYLASKGLDANRISAIGKGESQPTLKPTDCRKPGMTRADVIACLQPDRRVEIEVSGMKVVDPQAAPATRPQTRAPKTQPAPAARAPARVAPKAKAQTGIGL